MGIWTQTREFWTLKMKLWLWITVYLGFEVLVVGLESCACLQQGVLAMGSGSQP